MMSSFSLHNYSWCVDPCPKQKYMDVKCKVALVTGGTSGIGLAIADSLLACGLQKAVISGRNEKVGRRAVEYLLTQHGQGRAEYKALDCTNHKQFEDVYKDVMYKEGSVDILVNNAGMLNDAKWENTIDLNVKSLIRGILLANKYMPTQKNKGGCVVNVASILGFDAIPFAPVYSATKHAIVGLTRSFGAPENFSKTRVRQIALCPGVTITPLVTSSKDKQLGKEIGEALHAALHNMPVQTTTATGNATAYMIEYGPPGSLWTIENNILARVIPPNKNAYKKKVMDL